MCPVAGGATGAELVFVVAGLDQFPKRDLTAVGAAGCVVVMEPVEDVPVGVLVKPEKTDGVTVVLLDDRANSDVLVEETVGFGAVAVMVVVLAVRDGDCPKPELAVVLPKMGLKFWTAGLFSGPDVAEEEEEEVAVTAKMGLNPDASRGLELPADAELLVGAAAGTVFEAEEAAAAVLSWPVSPNRLAAATTGVLLEVLEV